MLQILRSLQSTKDQILRDLNNFLAKINLLMSFPIEMLKFYRNMLQD